MVFAADPTQPVQDLSGKADRFWSGFVDAWPRLGVGAVVLGVAWVVGLVVRRLLIARWSGRRTPSFTEVMSKLAQWAVVGFGVVVALTVVFPSIDPVNMVAGLGVLSVAAGFAFQDILSNLLSGLLLIVRSPFQSGDQIRVDDVEGTLEGVTIRETIVRTFDDRRVLIPNKDVYQGVVSIQTAFASVRTTVEVGVGYDTDLELAARTMYEAVDSVPGVRAEPAPQVWFTSFGESSIDADVRFWSDPHQGEVFRVRHDAVVAIKRSLDDAGIDIPFPIRTLDAAPSFADAVRGRGRDGARTGDEVPARREGSLNRH